MATPKKKPAGNSRAKKSSKRGGKTPGTGRKRTTKVTALPGVSNVFGPDPLKLTLDVVPVKVVGPTLGEDFDHQNLAGRNPVEFEQHYNEHLTVQPYPDPSTIEVDDEGYVKGYVIAAPGQGRIVAPKTGQLILPVGLLDQGLTGLPGIAGLPSLPGVAGLPQLGGPLFAKGGHPKKLPSPQLIHQVVMQYLTAGKGGGLQPVGKTGNLVFGELNGEFLNASKANYTIDSWAEITTRHHLMFVIETDGAGLNVIGKKVGYGHWCCKPNSRGQGVGFLAHPRLRKINGPIEIREVANVGGIPDLRPAYRIDFEDTVSGVKIVAVVIHDKSMIGGPAKTSPIRYEQNEEKVKALQGVSSVVIAGDFNCFLDNTRDTEPLVQAGYKLVYPNDHSSTQHMGGRLDGAFTNQMPTGVKLGRQQVRAFFKSKLIGRGFTDHGLLTWTVYGSGSPDTGNGEGGQADEIVIQ